MLKILFITQHFPPDSSGNASRIYDMSKKLVELGCKICVISPFPSFPHSQFKQKWKLFESEKTQGISHLSIFTWNPTTNDPSFIQRMAYYLIFPVHALFWTLINRKHFDIIISTSPPIFTGIPGLITKKITKKPFVYDVRDLWINAAESLGFVREDSVYTKLSRIYEKIVFDNSDLITVTTNQIKNDIAQENKINKSKIHVIPNGVDTKRFIKPKQKQSQIVYAGNIGHAQDLKKVIKAVKEINKKNRLTFLLVGDGDTKESLEEYVTNEGLEHIIKFKGSIKKEKIPICLSESMIGIAPLKRIPSLEYALPTKVYEYMAAGIPFIATGSGEIELLAKKSNAGVVAENTVESIKKHIELLITNKELNKQMGANGRIFSKQYTDRGKIAHHLYQLLQELK